jgi:hypothetical protein
MTINEGDSRAVLATRKEASGGRWLAGTFAAG